MSGDRDYGSRRGATSRDDNSRNDERQQHDSRSERNFSGMSGDNNYRSRRYVTSRDDGRQRYNFRRKMNSLADRNQDWRRRPDDVSTVNHEQETNYDAILRLTDNANRYFSILFEDTIKYFIPSYNEIREDRSIMENYKNNLRYIGDYLNVSEDKYNHEDIGFRFLKTEFCPDDRTKCIEVNFDLNVSMDKAEEYTKPGRFNCFLKCIAQEPEVLSSLKSNPDEKSEIKFLMTYYTLVKILQMPYLLNHLDINISLGACLESGVIYMYMCNLPSIDTVIDLNEALTDSDTGCETIETEGNDPSKEEFTEPGFLNRKFIKQNWSHKFKQYMSNEDVTKGIMPNEKFRIVVASKLGPYDVLVNPITDCLNPELYKGERDLSTFVRLYTTRCPFNSISREKCYEWALPMIVGGTEEMIAGYFNKSGIVSEVYSHTVDDLLKRGKGCGNLDKNFTFAVDFLHFVKKQTLANPGVDILFTKKKREIFLTCRKSFPIWVIEKGETEPKLKKMKREFQYNWFSEAVKNA